MTVNTQEGVLPDNSYIKWDDRFAIGIPQIDEQHKQLVQLCDDFYKTLMATRAELGEEAALNWHDSLTAALKAGVEYVTFHFSAEEKLMLACNYPDYNVHKAQHDEFSKKILTTAKNSDKWTYKDALSYVHFLYDWILSHIAHVDKLYVANLKEYLSKRC